ncbi:MAG: phosphonopyruvate decarboxylase [Spirochaetaceae bacterium]|jgi:phosphonopyruvate decarboxylase|nr:phosphonopyruvate decarboxylase [Spirochaetaceae bacterium]
MINPGFFCDLLAAHGTEFFTGVPDSLLKSFCAWVTGHTAENSHIIAVNEGAAAALASGYHLATGKIPLVYMQNSGIGNAVNPLLSLSDGDVYRIPMILLVGWRGEPGVKDEPQHLKQGKVTCALFEAMGIPYRILSVNEDEIKNQIEECYAYIKQNNTLFALIVRKDTFAPYTPGNDTNTANSESPEKAAELSREEAIEEIIRSSLPGEIFISTTGMASRELYELREKYNMGHERDFLTVGSMGHASSLALAVALQRPELPVNCIDGDGATLMHLGSMAAIGARKPANLRHIVLNNGAHDSVGGQPTIARTISLSGIARCAGYAQACSVKTREELRRALDENSTPGNEGRNGPLFIEVLVRKGSRKDLGRPRSTPQENKEVFMRFLSENT